MPPYHLSHDERRAIREKAARIHRRMPPHVASHHVEAQLAREHAFRSFRGGGHARTIIRGPNPNGDLPIASSDPDDAVAVLIETHGLTHHVVGWFRVRDAKWMRYALNGLVNPSFMPRALVANGQRGPIRCYCVPRSELHPIAARER